MCFMSVDKPNQVKTKLDTKTKDQHDWETEEKLRLSYMQRLAVKYQLQTAYQSCSVSCVKEHIKAVTIPLGCMFCSAWVLLALLQYLLFLILLS